MQFYRKDYRSVLDLLEEGTNRSDPYAVRRACAEFKRLVLHHSTMRHTIVEEGRLLPALMEIVSNHVRDEEGAVVVDYCRFVQRLISHKQPTELDIQSRITESGALDVMAKGLTMHPQSQRLYIEVCKLVSLLCFDAASVPHAENQAAIADAGLLAAICERADNAKISVEEAVAGCTAISALVYENDTNGISVIHTYRILSVFSTLLGAFPRSLHIVQCIFQTLFQLLTMELGLSNDVVDVGMLPQLVELLDSSVLMHDYHGAESFMTHWHIVKFLELCIRENGTTPFNSSTPARRLSSWIVIVDTAKKVFCSCAGPAVVVNTMIRRRQEPRHADSVDPWALEYISCMLLCRVITTTGNALVVDEARAKQLVQSSAHQLALDILRSVGVAQIEGKSEAHCRNFWAGVEQAVKLLELIATVESNRAPLTRLGASRQVKLIYNNPQVATQPDLLQLCVHAVANIEGT
ncbi:hypothetical protein P3T76_010159 [Phytophthora citrophthora]|uniref:Uncharacterized protein n=1 Tax=Phytophthora citrophthora TaxID=4793 RepID=A0AAD9GE24_9STRA|nr:hypothetical protein P3T76_010159 [Phytophthora citrophthora]